MWSTPDVYICTRKTGGTEVALDTAYNTVAMECSLDTIQNRNRGFEFAGIYNVYVHLNDTCAAGSDIFFRRTRRLNNAACERISGISGTLWAGWTAYPISDVWNRIVVWKLPLLQLLSQFPRPPLGPSVETGVMLHLLGDPIDSVSSICLSLAACRKRAEQAKKLCKVTGTRENHPCFQRRWKGLAIILVSYDECGLSEQTTDFCNTFRAMTRKRGFEDRIRHVYEEAAGSLAGDRQTRTLPVVLAEIFFIGGWIVSLIKAAGSEPSPTNWVNVEAQSIAISALYLWVTSAVVLGSVIGASQTEDAVPRILHTLEHDILALRGLANSRPSFEKRVDGGWCKRNIDRAIHGGTYSWRPMKWRAGYGPRGPRNAIFAYFAAATLFVGCSFLVSAILSYLVAPRGWSCRHIPESIVFLLWVLSVLAGIACENLCKGRKLFWAVFWKDLVCALSNIAIVIVVQWGIMNRCSCWSGWGSTFVHLPQLPEVKADLLFFIRNLAPWIVFAALMFHLLFCAAVMWKYWDAIRVFIQRDDGLSNTTWKAPGIQERNLKLNVGERADAEANGRS
ncbi:hypothetical protein BDU57DRAFT_64211 [Ampelomyces quisqualis]|uniref:Uncharacterized protein n=1 Tax=Ampelomyces quisqualis TaxID=50730 RepID=A0A6A5R494_AMPQU|nr:hypothetical protein BDU57DRAFT_64211 [Ampelomyces quisqualis]